MSWVEVSKTFNREILDKNIKMCIGNRKINHILIKPNLCESILPETGATVSVETVKLVIESIQELYNPCKISIVESDTSSRKIDNVYKFLGYDKLESDVVKLVNLSQEENIVVNINGNFFDKISIPKIFYDSDFFISIAKLKTHFEPSFPQGISCCLKNQFGCLSELKKWKYHCVLDKVIVDINTIIKPDLCIIDGDIGMEGNAPIHGNPKKVGLYLFSNDVVSIDCITSKIMGLNYMSIPHLNLAIESKLGNPEPYIYGSRFIKICNFENINQSFKDRTINRIRRIINRNLYK